MQKVYRSLADEHSFEGTIIRRDNDVLIVIRMGEVDNANALLIGKSDNDVPKDMHDSYQLEMKIRLEVWVKTN